MTTASEYLFGIFKRFLETFFSQLACHKMLSDTSIYKKIFFYSESRYLLLLTENYGALTILQQKIFTMDNAVVIFGSSFPSDQEYTQVIATLLYLR
jgi:hypothetical protein